jgi:hypothetical protein
LCLSGNAVCLHIAGLIAVPRILARPEEAALDILKQTATAGSDLANKLAAARSLLPDRVCIPAVGAGGNSQRLGTPASPSANFLQALVGVCQ